MDVNPHSAPSLSKVMARSLPAEASPQIKSFHDAVALAVHAAMLGVGYKLVGLGEDHRIEPPPQTQSSTDVNISSRDAEVLPLPLEWNSGGDETRSFRYTHDQSAMQYLVKVSRLGKKAVVFGLGMGDDKTASFDVAAAEFISESSIPATPLRGQEKEKTSDEDAREGREKQQTASFEEAARNIQDIFISAGRLSDLGSMIRLKLIQKLTPGIRKEGYEEDHPASTTTSSEPSGNTSSQRQQQQPSNPQAYPNPYPLAIHDPLIEPPAARARPFPTGEMLPPGFEDEHDILRPAGRAPPMMPPGGSPFGNVGERDLYPPGLGPRDPLRPHLGGVGGGGMHPTFDDPMFGGGGGQGYDPQAPPGARYDPVGPGFGGPRDPRGGMGGGGGRFPGGAGGAGGRGPSNPFNGFGSGDFI